MTITSVRNIRSTDTWVLDENGTVIGIQDANGSHQQLFGSSSDPASTPLSALRVITALDDRARFTCTTALPMEVPLGLSPPPSWVVFPPASGVVTITPTGGAKINGSTSPITRGFTANRLGVWFVPNPNDATDYSASGS